MRRRPSGHATAGLFETLIAEPATSIAPSERLPTLAGRRTSVSVSAGHGVVNRMHYVEKPRHVHADPVEIFSCGRTMLRVYDVIGAHTGAGV